MKTNDDVFINIHNVRLLLHRNNLWNSTGIAGAVWGGVRPRRNPNSRYYTPYSVYGGERFPSYCHGNMYGFTLETAKELLKSVQKVAHLPWEDVYMGKKIENTYYWYDWLHIHSLIFKLVFIFKEFSVLLLIFSYDKSILFMIFLLFNRIPCTSIKNCGFTTAMCIWSKMAVAQESHL